MEKWGFYPRQYMQRSYTGQSVHSRWWSYLQFHCTASWREEQCCCSLVKKLNNTTFWCSSHLRWNLYQIQIKTPNDSMGGITRFWFYFYNNIKGNLLAHSWASALGCYRNVEKSTFYRNLLWTPLWANCKPKLHCAHVCVVQRPSFHLWCWLSSSNLCSCDLKTTERRKKNQKLMWMYITHRGSLWATYAVAVMISGHTTVCKVFLEKWHSFWNIYRNNRKGSLHSNAVGMTVAWSVTRASPVRLLVVSEEWAKFWTCYLTN